MPRREPIRLWRRTPRPWHGMTVLPWLRLLARNHFAVSPGRIPMALAVSALAPLHSTAALAQRVRFGPALAHPAGGPPPLFIIGHWRTGTTLLHELLALDPQFRCPSTFQCMAPAHHLVTGPIAARHLGRLLPEHRPLDEMRLRADLPQEDEFALGNLGISSPYQWWAVPRRRVDWGERLDPRDFPPEDRARWERALRAFLGSLGAAGPGRPALKSPPHTARLGLLAGMFPGALFVHAVRDPYEMIPSFLVAWRRMAASVALQTGWRRDLDDFLLGLGPRLYRRFDEDRSRLGPGRIVDVRYEDLIADPAAELARVYQALGLPHAGRIPPLVDRYLAEVGEYRTNAHEAAPDLRRRITPLWEGYARRHGYRPDPPPPAAG
ncbi:MAG: hypothetical protein H6R33_712 [Actinobacteria bacterium]|nr:hypothetical protein [Actinomycetota bacterium]